jgi:hypothetical protein
MPPAATFAQLAGAAGFRRDDPLVITAASRLDLVILAPGDWSERRTALADALFDNLLT